MAKGRTRHINMDAHLCRFVRNRFRIRGSIGCGISPRGGRTPSRIRRHAFRCGPAFCRHLPAIPNSRRTAQELAGAGILSGSRHDDYATCRCSSRDCVFTGAVGDISLDVRRVGHFLLRRLVGNGSLAFIAPYPRRPFLDSGSMVFTSLVSSFRQHPYYGCRCRCKKKLRKTLNYHSLRRLASLRWRSGRFSDDSHSGFPDGYFVFSSFFLTPDT